jgi:hypothetical protein
MKMTNPSNETHEEYTVLPDATEEGFYKVKIQSGEFTGIIFNFGKVEFPDENEPILKFEYNLLEGAVEDSRKQIFEKTMGDMLVDLLRKAMEQKEISFKGGV